MKKIKNESGEIVGEKIKLADGFIDRLMGLMFQRGWSEFDALWIFPCNSIHTFFMLENIDVIFINKEMKIVKIIRHMGPWRMTWVYFKAYSVIELKAGTLSENIKEGQLLREYV